MGILRLFLALSVVLHHYGLVDGQRFTFMDGGLAVLLFFMISGFYMTLVLREKYTPQHHVSPKKAFYLARALRIYPPYLVVMFLAYTVFKARGLVNGFSANGLDPLGQALVSIGNLTMFGQDFIFAGVEDARNGSPITQHVASLMSSLGLSGVQFTDKYFFVPQAWSIAVELQFYLIAPFLLTSFRKTLAFLALTSLLRFGLYAFGLPSVPYAIRLLPFTLPFFLLGSISYYLYRILRDQRWAGTVGKYFFWAMCGGFVVLAMVSKGWHILPGGEFDDLKHWALYLAFCPVLSLTFLTTRKWKWDAAIGEYSYPIYLVHLLVLEQVIKPIHTTVFSEPRLFMFFSIVFAWFIVKAVDQPMDRLRAIVTRKAPEWTSRLKTAMQKPAPVTAQAEG